MCFSWSLPWYSCYKWYISWKQKAKKKKLFQTIIRMKWNTNYSIALELIFSSFSCAPFFFIVDPSSLSCPLNFKIQTYFLISLVFPLTTVFHSLAVVSFMLRLVKKEEKKIIHFRFIKCRICKTHIYIYRGASSKRNCMTHARLCTP